MTGIDDLAQSMLARCASHGHSVAEVADRHAQEALRAELWRLAHQWQLRIRTVALAAANTAQTGGPATGRGGSGASRTGCRLPG